MIKKLSHGLALSDSVLFEFDFDTREGEITRISEPFARCEVRHVNMDETLAKYKRNGYVHSDSVKKYDSILEWIYEDNITRARTKILVRWPNERDYSSTRVAYLVDGENAKPRTVYAVAWKVD